MIVVIDYGVGNLASVINALSRLNISGIVSRDKSLIKKANGLILPGVGAAREGMKNLKDLGLDKVVSEEIKRGKNFLGICLGMQLLFERSEEGNVKCLEILKGKVEKFKKERKVPQIGWNEVKVKSPFGPSSGRGQKSKVKIIEKIPDESFFYFVNSYYCVPKDRSVVIGETEYGEKFASLIVKDNIVATQFHPEKSGFVGMQFLKNWSSV